MQTLPKEIPLLVEAEVLAYFTEFQLAYAVCTAEVHKVHEDGINRTARYKLTKTNITFVVILMHILGQKAEDVIKMEGLAQFVSGFHHPDVIATAKTIGFVSSKEAELLAEATAFINAYVTLHNKKSSVSL